MAKQESQLFVKSFYRRIGWLNFQFSHERSFSRNVKQGSFVSVDTLTIKTELVIDICSVTIIALIILIY